MRVVREDDYSPALYKSFDDTCYTKLIHRLEGVTDPNYPEGFKLVGIDKKLLTEHVALCYPNGEHPDDLDLWRYMDYFMIGLVDLGTGRVVASAAADVDFLR